MNLTLKPSEVSYIIESQITGVPVQEILKKKQGIEEKGQKNEAFFGTCTVFHSEIDGLIKSPK